MAFASLKAFLGDLGAHPFEKSGEDGIFCPRESWDLVKDAPNVQKIPKPVIGPHDVHWDIAAVEQADANIASAQRAANG